MKPRAARILVVEDEQSIGQGLCDVLTFRGHEVTWAEDGALAQKLGREKTFDLVLLDIMLPLVDGFTVCRELRSSGMKSGIVMLTAKGSEEDILQGFEAGADDYVTKPFSLRLLLARIDAVLGRSLPEVDQPFSAGSLSVDPTQARAKCGEKSTDLSAREIAILRLLSQELGRIVSRRALLRDVWEMHNVEAVETRTVDVHVAKLRKKIGALSQDTIESVRGQGYRYVTKGNP